MKGFVITYLGKRCKIGSDDSFATMICSLVIQRNEFILEGGNLSGSRIGSWQRIQEGLEVEIEVAEFDDVSEDCYTLVDPEYNNIVKEKDELLEWNWKLEKFREIEKILKEENLL